MFKNRPWHRFGGGKRMSTPWRAKLVGKAELGDVHCISGCSYEPAIEVGAAAK